LVTNFQSNKNSHDYNLALTSPLLWLILTGVLFFGIGIGLLIRYKRKKINF
jgi:hypothetical protein